MKPISFQKKIKVIASDLDAQNHVNNLRYMEWVLEISEAHWVAKTSKETLSKYAWFVLTHYIEYKKQAFLGEELILKTWIKDYSNVKSKRCVEIIRESDNQLIVSAESNWCFINQNTRKPTAIPKNIVQAFVEFDDE
ncbi:MAG: acyl-CoA thioesterase [Psychroflexus sp.]